MKYVYDSEGNILGLNRGVIHEGEFEGTCTPQELVLGMDIDMYTSVAGVLTPKGAEEVAEIKAKRDVVVKAHQKVAEIKAELDARVAGSDPVVGSNSRNRDRFLAYVLKVVRKETKGKASAEETAMLDYLQSVDDYQEALCDAYDVAEAYYLDPARTEAEIDAYVVSWPVMN